MSKASDILDNVSKVIVGKRNVSELVLTSIIAGGHVLLEDVLLYFADEVFNAVSVIEKAIFSITRNADISPEDEAFDIDEDYCKLMKKVIRKRTRLAAVRLEIELIRLLKKQTRII